MSGLGNGGRPTRRGISFSPVSQQRGFYYRNEPGVLNATENVLTSTSNGQGYKRYASTAPNPAPEKAQFYKEGAFLGPSGYQRSLALAQSQALGNVRTKNYGTRNSRLHARQAYEWAKGFAGRLAREAMNNNNGSSSNNNASISTTASAVATPGPLSATAAVNNNNASENENQRTCLQKFGNFVFCRARRGKRLGGGKKTRKGKSRQQRRTRRR